MIISMVFFAALGVALIGCGYHMDSSENYNAFGYALLGVSSLGIASFLSLIHWIMA